MTPKREVTITKKSFGEDVESEQIEFWQAQGVSAIWNATFEILDTWFLVRGLDPSSQRIDRSVFEKRKAPWIEPENEE